MFRKIFSPVCNQNFTLSNIERVFHVNEIFPFKTEIIPEVASAPSTVTHKIFTNDSNEELNDFDPEDDVPLINLLNHSILVSSKLECSQDITSEDKNNWKNEFKEQLTKSWMLSTNLPLHKNNDTSHLDNTANKVQDKKQDKLKSDNNKENIQTFCNLRFLIYP